MRAVPGSRHPAAAAPGRPQPGRLTLFRWTLGLWVVTAYLLALQSVDLHPLRALELMSEDLRQVVLPPAQEPHPDIVVVAITETTFAQLEHRFPVDRRFLADLIGALAPARAIGIDLFLGEETTPAADTALIRALQTSRVPVTIGYLSAAISHGTIPLWQEKVWQRFVDRLGPQGTWSAGAVVFPVAPTDGVVRSYFFGRIEQDLPGFASAIAAAAGHTPEVGGTRRLAFRGNAATSPFTRLPAEAFLSPVPAVRAAMQDFVRDKIALVGVVLPVEERHRTPLSRFGSDGPGTPGVVVHAHALSQILDGTAVFHLSTPGHAIVVALLTLAGLGIALLPLALVWRTALFWLTGLGWIVVTAAAFPHTSLFLPLVPPLLGLALSYAGVEVLRIMRTDRLSRFDTYLLSGFLGPQVLDAVRAEPTILGRDGQVRAVTVLITDLEGSLTLIDHDDPSATITLIKTYFEHMADIVLEYGGTLDKFTGDGLLAFFGAPQASADSHQNAVACSLALLEAAERYRRAVAATGRPFGRTRIGLHADRSVVGNVGGQRRFDYTVLGLAPSLAARLEAANKDLGTSILMSGAVADHCNETILRRPLGSIRLRGAPGPLRLWEPLGSGREALAEATRTAVAAVEAGAPDRVAITQAAAAAHADDRFLQRLRDRVYTNPQTDPGPLLWDLTKPVASPGRDRYVLPEGA